MLIATVPHRTTVTAPTRIARTDSKTGRFYTITDPETGASVKYPSVTTILGVISKPALIPWAAKEERLAVSEAAADLNADPRTPGLPRSMYLLALEQRVGTAKAHTKVLAKAADIGSAVHAKIEWTLKRALGQRVGAEPVLEDAALWGFMAYEDWASAVSLRPKFIEQTVYSRQHEYAGTMDLLADLDARALLTMLERQGPVGGDLAAWLTARTTVTALIDFKTGKGIYGEAYLQSAAYQRALIEMGHGRPDGGLIVRLPKVTTDPAFEVAVVPNARQLMPAFLAARELWNWTYAQELAYQARRKSA